MCEFVSVCLLLILPLTPFSLPPPLSLYTSVSLSLSLSGRVGGVDLLFAGHLHRCLGLTCDWPVRGIWGDDRCSVGFKGHDMSGGGARQAYWLDPDGDRYCRRARISAPYRRLTFAGGLVVWSGSSSYQTYLKATFGGEGVRVEAFSSKGGGATKVTGGDKVHPFHVEEDLDFVIDM